MVVVGLLIANVKNLCYSVEDVLALFCFGRGRGGGVLRLSRRVLRRGKCACRGLS